MIEFLPNSLIFNDMPREGYKIFKGDLKEAGIKYITDEVKANFYSLRHTYCTRFARVGGAASDCDEAGKTQLN